MFIDLKYQIVRKLVVYWKCIMLNKSYGIRYDELTIFIDGLNFMQAKNSVIHTKIAVQCQFGVITSIINDFL